MHYPKQKQAFTLIELLIVVAIIAILAAIAVPNFLEAQVRAKVSRVKSDMRSIATALETYAVDNNAYPHSTGVKADGTIETPNQNMAGYPNKIISPALTTPIAYMTAVPLDIFCPPSKPDPEMRHYFYSYLAGEKRRFEPVGQWKPPHEYRFQEWGNWVLWACGPDGDRIDLGPPQTPAFGPLDLGYYDPTNGTASNGDILRTAKFTSLGG